MLNPIVASVAPTPRATWVVIPPPDSPKKLTLLIVSIVSTFTKASVSGLPPVIDTVGFETKSKPGSTILISSNCPLTPQMPVAPIPVTSLIFNMGGFTIS